MKHVRAHLIGAALSLTLLASSAGAAIAQDAMAPHPFGQECVSQIATMHDGGVGPHISGMHEDMRVGQHLQHMRTGHGCMHHMETGTGDS